MAEDGVFKWTYYGIIIKAGGQMLRLTSDYYIEMFCYDIGVDHTKILPDTEYKFDALNVANFGDYMPEIAVGADVKERYWNT